MKHVVCLLQMHPRCIHAARPTDRYAVAIQSSPEFLSIQVAVRIVLAVQSADRLKASPLPFAFCPQLSDYDDDQHMGKWVGS